MASFELGSSGSDTPPCGVPTDSMHCDSTGHLRPAGRQPQAHITSHVLTGPLEDFKTHAAVRFIEAGSYDAHDLPVVSSPHKKASKFSLKRSLRSVASCLASKAGGPTLVESYIAIDESSTEGAPLFVVRHMLQRNTHGCVVDENLTDIVASYSLRQLVDVSAFSVCEKDLFIFKSAPRPPPPPPPPPHRHHPSSTVAGTTEVNGPGAGVPSSSSSSVSHGDVGLELVFKDPTVGLSLAKYQFRKVEMHFMSSWERNLWLQCLESVYASNLLDSIRKADLDEFSSADMKRLVAENNRLMHEKPPPAVMERYIDFFLSTAAHKVTDELQNGQIIDPHNVPFGGILRIELGDEKYEIRRFAYKRSMKCMDSGEQEYLVICPTTVTQHIRMLSKCKLPISQLRVVVEEEHWGNTFFLEQTAEVTETHRESLLGVCRSQLSKFQSAFAAPKSTTCSNDFAITETIELQAGSFKNRIKWLKWFEAVLKKPVVYLSRVRKEKEVHETMRTPVRRATSLYPEFTASGANES